MSGHGGMPFCSKCNNGKRFPPFLRLDLANLVTPTEQAWGYPDSAPVGASCFPWAGLLEQAIGWYKIPLLGSCVPDIHGQENHAAKPCPDNPCNLIWNSNGGGVLNGCPAWWCDPWASFANNQPCTWGGSFNIQGTDTIDLAEDCVQNPCWVLSLTVKYNVDGTYTIGIAMNGSYIKAPCNSTTDPCCADPGGPLCDSGIPEYPPGQRYCCGAGIWSLSGNSFPDIDPDTGCEMEGDIVVHTDCPNPDGGAQFVLNGDYTCGIGFFAGGSIRPKCPSGTGSWGDGFWGEPTPTVAISIP